MDDELLAICDELGVINQLVDVSYLAASSPGQKNTSPIATLLDITSERLKKARADLDQYFVRLMKGNGE